MLNQNLFSELIYDLPNFPGVNLSEALDTGCGLYWNWEQITRKTDHSINGVMT